MLFSSLILFWIISNAILSYLLNLAPDEAYYWVWSNYLSFGYFDHPPLIAFSIKVGYLIFKNELGVRFLTIILTTISIIILYKMLKRRDEILFSLLILSNLLLNAGGFIAVPDGLLVFSESLFFYFLRNYLMKDNFKDAFFVSVSIALMLYSKYHSVLIILFTIITTWKTIFKRMSFYLIFALSLMFYLPHIIWQFENDFITIKYQLFEREGLGFEINNVFDYVLGQFLVYGPLVGFITIISSFLYKPKDVFENVLKVNLIGTLLFFFIMSFRNKIEANWTCPIIFPLIYLSYHYLIEKNKLKKIFISISVINAILIFILKIHILFPIFHFQNDPTSQFRNWNLFSKEVKRIVEDNSLCATNYQLASELYFYLKKPVGFYKLHSRDNQFSILKLNINCQYIVSHIKTENVIDSLNAPYLGKVYIILNKANLSMP